MAFLATPVAKAGYNDGNAALTINSNTGDIVINDIDDLNLVTNSSINLQVNVSDGIATSNNEKVTVKLVLDAGDLDPNFGTGGKVITSLGSDRDQAKSAAIQADGKIVVTGYTVSNGAYVFALPRYNLDGSLDNNSFGTNGKVITPVGTSSFNESNTVAIQSDGKIVVAGQGSNTFALVRYNMVATALML